MYKKMGDRQTQTCILNMHGHKEDRQTLTFVRTIPWDREGKSKCMTFVLTVYVYTESRQEDHNLRDEKIWT